MSEFDTSQFWKDEAEEHIKTAQESFDTLQPAFANTLRICTRAIQSGGKILFFGNGGSAADAQHLATELTIRYKKDRKPIPAIALTTDTSALTAGGNDIGFDAVFARQIDAIGRTGDVAIGISTSGNSPNVLNALKAAQNMDIQTIGFSGRDGGSMKALCDEILIVPSNTTARIQEMHIFLGHLLCGGLEEKLGLV